MARRRRRTTQTTTTPDPIDDVATATDDYSPRTGNSVPGMGGLYLTRNSADAIDALDPRLNRWAMFPAIMQVGKILIRRPLASSVSLLVAFGGLSLGIGILKSTVLVATGKATAVSSRDITDPTSANQVGLWVGSQIGAPVLQTGSTALVNWAGDSAASPAQTVSATQPAGTWGVTEVSDRSTPTGGKIQLIPGRR